MIDTRHSPSDQPAWSRIGVLLAAIAIGISFAGLMSGRAPFGAIMVIAVLAMFLSGGAARIFRGVTDLGRTVLGVSCLVTLLAWIPSTLLIS